MSERSPPSRAAVPLCALRACEMSFGGPKPGELRNILNASNNMSLEVLPTSAQAHGPRVQDRQNVGYSGTPMWKIALDKQNAEKLMASMPKEKLPEGFVSVEKCTYPGPVHYDTTTWYFNDKKQVFWNAKDGKMYVWDGATQKHKELYEAQIGDMKVSVGACFHEKASQVKHVLVNDLAKASQALRMNIDHLDRPCALYALYEGHRGGPGNACADFVGKNLHMKLLPKLVAFRGFWEDERLEAALTETFEELDSEFREKHPSATEGCCAAVALITGRRLALASLGDVAGVVCMKSGEAIEKFKPHAVKDPDDDDDESDEDEDPAASRPMLEAPPIRWTRAFGDQDFKKPGSIPLLTATPDVAVIHLDQTHRGFAFICRALYNAIGRSVAVSTVFRRSAGRPRMASGALVDAAVQWLGQVGDLGLGSIVVFFDRPEDAVDNGPAQKKPRLAEPPPTQVRLRHIVLKHKECKSTMDKVRNKQVKRHRGEAERSLRAVLEDPDFGKSGVGSLGAKKTAFTTRCKELSECQSALKTGDLIGDLGWVKPGKHGAAFDAAAFALQVGQLSDLVDSDQGIHIIMRTA